MHNVVENTLMFLKLVYHAVLCVLKGVSEM